MRALQLVRIGVAPSLAGVLLGLLLLSFSLPIAAQGGGAPFDVVPIPTGLRVTEFLPMVSCWPGIRLPLRRRAGITVARC